jgi:hypothetical protein
MQHAVESRPAPVHLWIVGILSLLWSGFGSYDYLMTRMRNDEWITSMMPGTDPNTVYAWVDSFPVWAQFGWGLGVWLGLAGSLFLLIRSRHAVWAYGLSLLGAVLGLGYQLLNPMPGVTGFMATGMPIVIIAICVGLFVYARAQRASGVLR